MHTLIYQHHKPSELMLCNLNSCAASARTSEETSDCRWLASCVVLLVWDNWSTEVTDKIAAAPSLRVSHRSSIMWRTPVYTPGDGFSIDHAIKG